MKLEMLYSLVVSTLTWEVADPCLNAFFPQKMGGLKLGEYPIN